MIRRIFHIGTPAKDNKRAAMGIALSMIKLLFRVKVITTLIASAMPNVIINNYNRLLIWAYIGMFIFLNQNKNI
jgi:hypothetical protein